MKTTHDKTTVIVFRNEEGTWTLARYKGDIIPKSEFPTLAAARAYAKSQGWQVRRAFNCDE